MVMNGARWIEGRETSTKRSIDRLVRRTRVHVSTHGHVVWLSVRESGSAWTGVRPRGVYRVTHAVPRAAGSRLLPMRNQFQFRAASPPAMLFADPAASRDQLDPSDYLATGLLACSLACILLADRRISALTPRYWDTLGGNINIRIEGETVHSERISFSLSDNAVRINRGKEKWDSLVIAVIL